MIATLDFETYSEAGYKSDPASESFVPLQAGKPGIKGINAAVYAEHPSTRVISLAYNLLDGCGTRLWTPGSAVPVLLFNYVWEEKTLEAHNSLFEFYIWEYVCHQRMGWPKLKLEQLLCSQAKAQANGYPGALGKLSIILDSSEKKKDRGSHLIRLLSVPKKPTKRDPLWYRSFEKYPELYYEMYDYNAQDVNTEMSISNMLPELSETELKVWQLNQRVNARGVQVDNNGLNACINLFEKVEKIYIKELQTITKGAVKSAGEIAKLKSGDLWLQSIGVNLSSLDKMHVDNALERNNLPAHARRVLEIRKEIGGSAVKKIYAIQRYLNRDGRIRDLFTYCGAERTGRWAGRGPQPQNLKNGGPDCTACTCGYMGVEFTKCPRCGNTEEITDIEWGNTTTKAALYDIAHHDIEYIERTWGSVTDLIGSCMRGLFVAAPGYELICSDYSAIEAVVLAALAGEEWRLEVFRTHGKIYEASAAKIFKVPLQKILDHKKRTGKHHPLRKKGKVCELANGYSGWIGAAKAFGHTGTDEEIKNDILTWRADSPNIVEMWGGQWRKTPGRWEFTPDLYGVEGAFITACLSPDITITWRDLKFTYHTKSDILDITLPSGRNLRYHSPRLNNGTDQRGLSILTISYTGVDSYTYRWSRIPTYGGKLTENITQAVARDILAAAMLRLDAAGYPIVLHVHDEIVAEIPARSGNIEEFENIMMQRENWFKDWPIKASGGWMGHRYRK